MDPTYMENNLYLNDVMQLELCQEYKEIIDLVTKNVENYFVKNYKKLRFEDFIDTNDYNIQRIKIFTNTIQKAKTLDNQKYSQCLQNFIVSIEHLIMSAAESKIVRDSISGLKTFLTKTKQQNALIWQLEMLEAKSRNNTDYILLMEKLCVLVKAVFDISDVKTNKKFNLYNYINRCLNEEKFLQERKSRNSRKRMITVKTALGTNFYNILNEDLKPLTERNKDKKFILPHEDEETQKKVALDDNEARLIRRLPEEKEEMKEGRENYEIVFTNDACESKEIKLLTNVTNSEPSSRQEPLHFRGLYLSNRTGSQSACVKNYKFLLVENTTDTASYSNSPCKKLNFYKDGSNDIISSSSSNTADIIEKYKKSNKGIKSIKGDCCSITEFDEKIFEEIKGANILEKEVIGANPRQSAIFKLISKEDLKGVRERSPTPEKLMVSDSPIKRSMSKEVRTSTKQLVKISPPEEKTAQINTNVNIPINDNVIHNNSKMMPIYTNSNSIIQLPPNYMTNDSDLKMLCDLINEPTEKPWKKVMEDKIVRIHKKSTEGSPVILIKTVATLDGFTREEVFEAIANVNIRKQWDKVFSEFKIVETNDEEQWEVLYMSIKAPSVFIKDRDFVQKRKIWRDFPDSDSSCLHFKSIAHKQCPELPKFIRAETIISGYFIKALSTSPPKTLVAIISQTDIRGAIPTWIVNSVAQKAPKEWVNSLMKGCEKVRTLQKNKK